MSGPAILPPMTCRKSGRLSDLCSFCNGYAEMHRHGKTLGPQNANFSQSKNEVFRNKSWSFSISAQLAFDMRIRRNLPIFRNQIWCFFANWVAELVSKRIVASFPKADLVDVHRKRSQSGSGNKI